MALALARVSTFCVDDETVNGPNDELAWLSFGKFLNCNVTCVLPVCEIKSGINTITSNIESGDFDITAQRSALGGSTGLASFRGDGEFIMKIRRFVPDFISQTGNTQITLQLRNYPNDSYASSSLGPFTISSSTSKVDTRARARAVSLKIANTAASQSWKLGTFRLDIQPDGRR